MTDSEVHGCNHAKVSLINFMVQTTVAMMTLSNGDIFRVTGHLCGEFSGPRWIPRTKISDGKLWCFLWINRYVNNCEARDSRRYRTHDDVIVMQAQFDYPLPHTKSTSNKNRHKVDINTVVVHISHTCTVPYLHYIDQSRCGCERQCKLQMPPVSHKVSHACHIEKAQYPKILKPNAYNSTTLGVEHFNQQCKGHGQTSLSKEHVQWSSWVCAQRETCYIMLQKQYIHCTLILM